MNWRTLQAEVAAVIGASEARWIVEEASGFSPAELVVFGDEEVTARCGAYVSQMLARRLNGEPLQYVLGSWGFRSLTLMVDQRVLIPRPETEEVVGWAIEAARALGRRRVMAADLGTGSGAIALSLASELSATVWATEISPDALDVARANLAGLGGWGATRVTLCEGSWWDALPADLRGGLDLVVSNPPYVAGGDALDPMIAEHEPAIALWSGPAGLDALTEIVVGAGVWLSPGGALVVEIDPRQASSVVSLALSSGFASASVRVDTLGRDRAVVATWPT